MNVIMLLLEEADKRRLLAKVFRKHGFAVVEATTAAEMRAFVEAGIFPNLIFIDLGDAEKTGEFSLEVKYNLQCEPIPVWVGGFLGFTNLPEDHGPLPDRYFGSSYTGHQIVDAYRLSIRQMSNLIQFPRCG